MSMTLLNWPTPKTPGTLLVSATYLLHEQSNRVIANYVLKFPNFRYHGDKGRSDAKFNGAIKLKDPKTP